MKCSRVVLSDVVDWCIYFTSKIQHGGDWERSRPQGPKIFHNFLMTVRPLSWAWGHGTEMLLIFATWLFTDIFWYDSPRKCPTILYTVNLCLKPVSATGAKWGAHTGWTGPGEPSEDGEMNQIDTALRSRSLPTILNLHGNSQLVVDEDYNGKCLKGL